MPQIKAEVQTFARIKVVGVGGSGKNALNHMINAKVKGVEFIAVNTGRSGFASFNRSEKNSHRQKLDQRLGTGMNPDLGKRAVEETKEEVQEAMKGADMVFIAGGLGGGTCTGAAPGVARTAKEQGALTIAVVTKPFFLKDNTACVWPSKAWRAPSRS